MALEPVCVLALTRSLQTTSAGSGKPFGPVLNLVEAAQARGVRVVRIAAKPRAPA